jgi:parallel beta-helix repeat protein
VESNDVKEKYVPVCQPIPKRPPDGLNLPRLMWTICKRWNDEFLEKKRIVLKETERLLTHKAYTHARTNYTIVIEDSFERFIFQQTIEWLGRGELLNRIFSGIMLTLLLTSMLPSAFIILPVKAAGGTIYIRADGSIDPPTAPIQRDGDVYTFTDNIYDSIIVQRSNIIIDGAGYTLQGPGYPCPNGFDLGGTFSVNNVTIQKTNIKGFQSGIYLFGSSYNTLSENNITNNLIGIGIVSSSSNSIVGNKVADNDEVGMVLAAVSGNNMLRNNSIVRSKYYNFYIAFDTLLNNDVDTSNTVDGKPIYYWINRQNMDVPSDAGFVVLKDCYNITVQGL